MAEPEKVFNQGSCRTAIFANEIKKDGKTAVVKKAVFQKRYRDKNGEWKNTNSLDVNDIPKAVMALNKAYDYLTSKDEK